MNEASIRSSLQVRSGELFYQSQPTAFEADVAGSKGPSPGAITVSVFGTNIDLSQLVTPALCRVMNLDPTNYVEYGIRDPATGVFYPLGEILPGETYILRLSRNIQEDYYNTGTGTTASINFFHFKANKAPCVVVIEAFER